MEEMINGTSGGGPKDPVLLSVFDLADYGQAMAFIKSNLPKIFKYGGALVHSYEAKHESDHSKDAYVAHVMAFDESRIDPKERYAFYLTAYEVYQFVADDHRHVQDVKFDSPHISYRMTEKWRNELTCEEYEKTFPAYSYKKYKDKLAEQAKLRKSEDEGENP